MKKILHLILFLSLIANVSLFIKWKAKSDKFNAYNRLFNVKDISHKQGFKSFREQITNNKPNMVYFWDSLQFDLFKNGMRQMDSLASINGKYSFNYIFATEMDQQAAEQFLTRNGIRFENFKVMGDADDFISGVYTEKPAPSDMYFMNGKQYRPDKITNKHKGYYFLMDNKGQILYYAYKNPFPADDQQFINKIKSINPIHNEVIY